MSGEWTFYDLPWWAGPLWGFAIYATARFLVSYIRDRVWPKWKR